MPSFEIIIAGAMIVSLTFYALMGGADYGGGVWDLFATGPRANAQRELIAEAIGPIWEANHVWLILLIVLFPPGIFDDCYGSAYSSAIDADWRRSSRFSLYLSHL
jgi:cytochrome d ubiquinol oxidase subunit II